jgi:uncharacterized protein
MAARSLTLHLLPGELAVCRLRPEAAVPEWALAAAPFTSITRTASELSVVCPAERVPAEVRSEAGWRCLAVAGPLDFSETGVLAALAAPLAEAGISLFAVSTFDTDYLLVRAADLQRAVEALIERGHRVER